MGHHPDARASEERTQVLAFQLGPKTLALPAETVVEVAQAVAIAAVPTGPRILEGVLNHRGTVIPVLDVRHRFDVDPRPLDIDQHFIVAYAGPRTVALRVDRALDLVELASERVAAADTVPEARLAAGVMSLPDGALVIHDLAAFLSADEAEQVDAAVAAAPPP